MVECSAPQQNQVTVDVISPELLGLSSVPHHRPFVHVSSDPGLGSMVADAHMNTPSRSSSAMCAGNEFDRLLQQCHAPNGELQTVSSCQEAVTAALESATSSESNASALYLTSLKSVNTPPTVQPVSSLVPRHGQLQAHCINAPLSTDRLFLSTSATPVAPTSFSRLEANALSFPTTSASNVKLPPEDKPRAALDPSCISQRKLQLLQACRFGKNGNERLEESRIISILRAEAELLSDDCTRTLQPLINLKADEMPVLEALGLPSQWKGLEGAVNYYRTLETEKTKPSSISPFAKRLAQVLFYLNYRFMEKHAKGPSNSVATLILNACPEEPKNPMLMKTRRDNITGYHKRRGKWWWIQAACLGCGILTHAAGIMETMYALSEPATALRLIWIHSIKSTFTKNQLQVFISLVLRTRPGSVSLFGRWEPVIKAIALGTTTSDLRRTIQAGITDTAREKELTLACTLDQEALSCEQLGRFWLTTDVESIAEKKILEFLPNF